MARFLLDTTVLIDHLRGDVQVVERILDWLDEGHELGISCVNVAEVESGLLPTERDRASRLLSLLSFLVSDPLAASTAGSYQASLRRRGVTLSTADALIAGTAKRHGATVVTTNVRDFPIGDLGVIRP